MSWDDYNPIFQSISKSITGKFKNIEMQGSLVSFTVKRRHVLVYLQYAYKIKKKITLKKENNKYTAM